MRTVLQTFVVLSSFRKVLRGNLAQSLHPSQQSHSASLSSNTCYNFKMVHTKCREKFYHYRTDDGSFGKVARLPVPDQDVPWAVPLPSYKPVEFTAPFVLTAAWADPELGTEGFQPVWNTLDGKVNRVSHDGEYTVDKNNRPLNLMGRTGVSGRGVLGRWGPNHAADPVVTRWRRDANGEIEKDETTGKNILEFVSIQRRDNGEWAIPGGMVDPGEKVSTTVKREFMEEALDSTGTAKDNLPALKEMVEKFFAGGEEVYKGYVDDPRNTDNAWMETVAFSFHDSTGSTIGKFPLQAGDDAASICWMALSSKVSLYASHKDMLELVVNKLKAHW
jgi:ADP-ribose pyrophosphatase